jgi:hypothetical protein
LEANAREVVIYYKGVGYGDGHACLTYIEDDAANGTAELDVGAGGRSGAYLKAAVARGTNRLNQHMGFGVGCSCFCFCRYVRSFPRLIPLRDFQECC